ncbi:MAG: hypothetical protein Q9190_005757 [Brigantiaea leucoxantha]
MNSPYSTDLTELSSELSSIGSLSPPPPFDYPSPQSSQDSITIPLDSQPSSRSLSREPDGQPLPKRRRKVEPKPKTTEYLDLASPPCSLELDQSKQLDLLLKALRKRKKIVVIAGAGISVSAGSQCLLQSSCVSPLTDSSAVPDFRSATGLFSSLRTDHKLKSSGKHLFDASVYQTDVSTSHFHDMVRSLSHLVNDAKPTAFHHMLATLAKEDRLMRLYTQNVDGIDTALPPLKTEVPLTDKGPWPRTIQLHGGLQKMVCSKCNNLSDFEPALFDGPVAPLCTLCVETDKIRTDHAGKRSHGIGRLRPRMVLYNEHNPEEEAIGHVVKADLRARPDAVIVVGTSMKIPGVKRIVREMCGVVRGRRNGLAVWINHGPPPAGKEFEDCWDLVVKGSSDQVASQASMKQWDDDSEDVEECTESEAERARQDSDVKILIQTPEKTLPTPHMPTPAPSPGPKRRPPIPKLKFPKALKHILVLDNIGNSSDSTSSKHGGSISKASTKPKTHRSKKPSSKPASDAKINKSYKVVKPRPSAATTTTTTKKSKPPNSFATNFEPFTAMAPISPQAARNNGPLPTPAMLFPNLNVGEPIKENNELRNPQSSPLTPPLSQPPTAIAKQSDAAARERSASLQRSCGEITSPVGGIPSGMENLLH